jgi:hypothetical protein
MYNLIRESNRFTESYGTSKDPVEYSYYIGGECVHRIFCPICKEFTMVIKTVNESSIYNGSTNIDMRNLTKWYCVNTDAVNTTNILKLYSNVSIKVNETHCMKCGVIKQIPENQLIDLNKTSLDNPLLQSADIEKTSDSMILLINGIVPRIDEEVGELIFLNIQYKYVINYIRGTSSLVIYHYPPEGDKILYKRIKNLLYKMIVKSKIDNINIFSRLDDEILSEFMEVVTGQIRYLYGDMGCGITLKTKSLMCNWGTTSTSCTYIDDTSNYYNYYSTTLPDSYYVHSNFYSNKKVDTFIELLIYNRFPHIEFHSTKELIEYYFYGKHVKKDRMFQISHDDRDHIATLLRIHYIPYSRAIYNLVKKNPVVICRLPNIMQYFKKIDNIRKLVHGMGIDEFDLVNVNDWDRVKNGVYSNKSAFMDMMLRKYGETGLCNKILNHVGYLKDCITMYNEAYFMVDPNNIKGNLKEIHDYLSYVVSKIENDNVSLREDFYTRYQRDRFEYSDGDFTLRFPIDTHELRDINQILKICTAAYIKDVLNGVSAIMVIKKGSKYVNCVELDRTMEKVKQAKCFDNKKPEGELREFILKWIDVKGLMLSTKDLVLDEARIPRPQLEYILG